MKGFIFYSFALIFSFSYIINMLNKKYLLLAVLVIVFLIISFAFVNREHPEEAPKTEEIILEEENENPIETEVSLLNQEEENLEIKEEKQAIIPNLDREIIFPEAYSSEAQEILLEKIGKNIAKLKEDPNSVNDWLELGTFRKMIEDFEGAEEAWLYAGSLNPKSFVIWSNLGDLYALYIRDNLQAEKYYTKALDYGYKQESLYFKIVDFYKNFLNNPEKAIEIAELGVEQNPNSQSLQKLLTSLK